MKRDWEIIRLILKKIQDESTVDLQGYDQTTIRKHLCLLKDGGLINGVEVSSGVVEWETYRLTWQGHDLLETALTEPVYGYPLVYRAAV